MKWVAVCLACECAKSTGFISGGFEGVKESSAAGRFEAVRMITIGMRMEESFLVSMDQVKPRPVPRFKTGFPLVKLIGISRRDILYSDKLDIRAARGFSFQNTEQNRAKPIRTMRLMNRFTGRWLFLTISEKSF